VNFKEFGKIPYRMTGLVSPPKRPDRLWDPPSRLFKRYWKLFPCR